MQHLPHHRISRRALLGRGACALAGAGLFTRSAAARAAGRRVIFIHLAGGPSQLETWDPKPGHANGGPFGAVETRVPGVRISELLPSLARQMHRIALVRGVDSAALGDDHYGAGIVTGAARTGGARRASFVELAAAALPPPEGGLPAHVELLDHDAFRLESRFPAPPGGAGLAAAVLRPGAVPGGGGPDLASLCDAAGGAGRDRERYGSSLLGDHCRAALRLAEAGVPVVRIRHAWWDGHAENFTLHRRLAGELDRALGALLQDLHDRGLLASTLVIAAGEFGRSPHINADAGRDHWPHAWSVMLAGAGIAGGTVVGKTSADGSEVTDGRVTPAELHRTWYRALGLETRVPLPDPRAEAVAALLA